MAQGPAGAAHQAGGCQHDGLFVCAQEPAKMLQQWSLCIPGFFKLLKLFGHWSQNHETAKDFHILYQCSHQLLRFIHHFSRGATNRPCSGWILSKTHAIVLHKNNKQHKPWHQSRSRLCHLVCVWYCGSHPGVAVCRQRQSKIGEGPSTFLILYKTLCLYSSLAGHVVLVLQNVQFKARFCHCMIFRSVSDLLF